MTNEVETLKKENESLKKTILDIENISKMLIKRDVDLRNAYNELKTLDKERSEFLSIAAHQLRTPLTTVNFAVQLLSESISSSLDKDQLHVLSNAKVGIKKMSELIEDLLTVDSLDYSNSEFTKDSVDIEATIIETVESLNALSDHQSVTIETKFSTNPVLIQADARRVKDAIANVIHNAVKYTQSGGNILITTTYEDGFASVTVSDTGIGVAIAEANKLFKKFSRCDSAKQLDANGSGLGLYIAKKIMEKHDGSITYAPRKPHGSSFILSFPL